MPKQTDAERAGCPRSMRSSDRTPENRRTQPMNLPPEYKTKQQTPPHMREGIEIK